MTYRQLTVNEWSLIEPYFAEREVPMPDPKLATIFGAFEDGKKGKFTGSFLVCQFKLHTEPLVSSDPQGLLGLIQCAHQHLLSLGLNDLECFVGVSDERVMRLAWTLGYRPGESMFVRRLNDELRNQERK